MKNSFRGEKRSATQRFVREAARPRLILLLALASLAAPCTFASLAACTTSTTNSVNVTGSQIAGAPIAAAGSGDDFTTLSTSPVTGCQGTDINFQNFTETETPLGTTTAAGTYVSTLTNQDITAGAVDALFSTVRGADGSGSGGNGDGGKNDAVNNWEYNSTANTITVNYTEATTSGPGVQFFALSMNGVQDGSGGITGTISLCAGGTFVSAVCTGGTLQTISVTNGTNFYVLNLGAQYTQIGIENSFTLNGSTGASGGNRAFITSFSDDFEETPEPSTFVLLGSALAAVGLLRLRARRKSAV